MSIEEKSEKYAETHLSEEMLPVYGKFVRNTYSDAYKECLVDLKKEINRLTVERYQFPLLHIFDWIDKKLGVK